MRNLEPRQFLKDGPVHDVPVVAKEPLQVLAPFSKSSVRFVDDKDAFKNCPNLLAVTFDDEDNWYVTQDETNWQKKMMGTHIDVSDSSTNAFALAGNRYYFYKLEDE